MGKWRLKGRSQLGIQEAKEKGPTPTLFTLQEQREGPGPPTGHPRQPVTPGITLPILP